VRIFYDHQAFSLQNNGGNSRYHFELMRHLARYSDVRQELFLGFHQSAMPFQDLAGDNLRVVGWKSSLRPGGRRFIVNEFLSNADALARGRFDIYHPTHHRYLPLVRARSMVATQHDCTQEKFAAEFRYNDRVLRYRKALFARADRIICISEASRQDLLHFYNVDPAKTCVIHHGFTRLEHSPQAAEELRRQLRRDYVLYVGSRALYKNFRGLLHAFRDAGLQQTMDLVVLGGGPVSPVDERLISDLGLSSAMVRIPRVTDALLAEAYAGARLLAYPSLHEGFGLPPLEAMYLGCPVLVCNTASLPEVCDDAAFYYEKDEPESLQKTLLRAVQDESAHAQAITRGRQVAARFTWEKCAEQTLAVYRERL
jgi:glycosyltransferase involved in cell wall biosynthesis